MVSLIYGTPSATSCPPWRRQVPIVPIEAEFG